MSKFVFLAILLLFSATPSQASDENTGIVVRNRWCSNKDSLIVYEGGFNQIQVYGKDVKASEVRIRSLSSKLRIGETEIKGDTASAIAMPMDNDEVLKLAVVNKKDRRGHPGNNSLYRSTT